MSDDQGPGAELAPTPVPEPAELAGMTAVVSGKFAVYQNAVGGVELFYDIGEGTMRKTVPAAVVKMAMGNGAMSRTVRKMMGEKA